MHHNINDVESASVGSARMADSMKAMPWFDTSINFSNDNGPMFGAEEAPKRHAACDECSKSVIPSYFLISAEYFKQGSGS